MSFVVPSVVSQASSSPPRCVRWARAFVRRAGPGRLGIGSLVRLLGVVRIAGVPMQWRRP
eukprot:9471840-Pyramimonas_sp.AAC.1